MPPPPPPHSGRDERRGPYGPMAGRIPDAIPVTPPAVASAVLQNPDDMDVDDRTGQQVVPYPHQTEEFGGTAKLPRLDFKGTDAAR
eukprot:351957-Amphidinium_carterae.1